MGFHPALSFVKLIESGREDLAWSFVNLFGSLMYTLTAFLGNASAIISMLSIYQSLTNRLKLQIDELIDELSTSDDGFSIDKIIEILDLFMMIKITDEHFSFPMLFLIIQDVVSIIGGVYLFIDTAMNPTISSLMKGVNLLIYTSYLFSAVMVLLILNYPSEVIRLKIFKLKDVLSLIETNEEVKHEFQDKSHNETHIRNWMVEKLGTFQGFDMGGFSVLGKSLLGSIVTNTLTYLIVLVQFKISERPQNLTS